MCADGVTGGFVNGQERRVAAVFREAQAGLTDGALRLLRFLLAVAAYDPERAVRFCDEALAGMAGPTVAIETAVRRLRNGLADRFPLGALSDGTETRRSLEYFGILLSYDADPVVSLSGRLLLQDVRRNRRT